MTKLHLIGNAHLDPVWLWRWQEGFSEILATFKSALDRMDDFPDFKFTCACASYYQWIEKVDLEMFKKIQKRVAEGRWNIVGGWFLQPDCNMPSGESFARHGLISQRYFKEKFGKTVKTGYNVDSFGHNAGIPKILKNSGMENYVFMRPDHNEKDLEKNLFIWQGDDGSRILTYRIPWSYNVCSNNLNVIEKIKEKSEKDKLDYMVFYGVGNHGGGPTIKLINEIKNLDTEGLEFSTPDEYFKKSDTTGLDIITTDLQHHARGCYSACSYVKAQNRRCEQNLLAAEKLAVMAKELLGTSYPAEKLKKAWKNLLFNQFHDILGGCSIKKAYEDAGYLFGEIMSITEQIINEAMQKIAWNIDTLQGEALPGYKEHESWTLWEHEVLGTPVVVFNPHAWEVTMPLSIYTKATKITDWSGAEIPFQIVRGDQTNYHDKHHTAFNATVPAYGYSIYRIFREKESECEFDKILKAENRALENEKIRVEFDSFTGDICSFYDKENGEYIINKPCRAILLDESHCDTWAHNQEQLGTIVGLFDNPEFSVIEDGNVRATLKVITKHNKSTLQREYSIIPGSKELKVKVRIDFHEQFRTLKFTFPVSDTKIISQTAYGTIKKDLYTGEEPFGMWFANGSLCVANDSKYGYDSQDGEIRLTVLRSAIYADHYGMEDRDDFCEFMEQGIHEFTYSIFPYCNNAQAEKKAQELNFGLRHVMGSFHDGILPENKSMIKVSDDNIIVSAIKESEDKSGNIIRFFDIEGKDFQIAIDFFDKKIETHISHNELKTFTDDGTEVNLIEW